MPGDLVVLAIGVVVAVLAPTDLITAQDHGDTLGEKEGGEEVADLTLAEGLDGGIVARALDAAVPGGIVVRAVAVLLPVRLVVLQVIRDEVGQGESVMSGDEFDARRARLSAARLQRSLRAGREPVSR